MQAPRFEVDPMWPKPLPNHWVIGQRIGVSVDAQDHIWIIHRGASLERMEILRRRPIRLRRSAASPRRRSSSSMRKATSSPLGRTRQGLRLAGFEPRHHRRLQRQRVDRRQRPRRGDRRAAAPC